MTDTSKAHSYFRLLATGLSRRDEDDFTQACFELGASGVAEDLKFSQKDLRYDPDVVETAHLDMNVYFTEASREQTFLILEKLKERFAAVRLEMTSEENKDWLAEWKKGFIPFQFSGPFWVIPSWLEAPKEAGPDTSRHIYVEPGMAFGTGTHETTRLAAGLVIEAVLDSRFSRPVSLLDVGTGTGILALIASRLGVAKLVGIDIDPEARRTARENLQRNQESRVLIPELNIDGILEQYDIVVANIIDGVLTTLRHELSRCLKRGGRMIVSGVLMDRENEFYKTFTADSGLKVIKRVSEGEWSAALLEKTGD